MALWCLVLQCVIIGVVANENSLPINQIYSLAAALTTAETRILGRIEQLSDEINKLNDRVDDMKHDISSIELVLMLGQTKESYKDKSLQHTSDSSSVGQNLSAVQTETNKMFTTTQKIMGKLSERMISLEHQLERLPEKTGVYFMKPNASIQLNFTVSRDWTNNHGFGGNWIVFQRRSNGSLNFYRNWTEYKEGLGDVHGDHWLGLDKLYAIVTMGQHELLIVLEDFDGVVAYAHYDNIKIGSESEKYVIKSVGQYKGTAGDSFLYHKDEKFSTYDQDNDQDTTMNCAEWLSGAWWFYKCFRCHLNGEYVRRHPDPGPTGIMWLSFRGTTSLKSTRMMVRPAK